MTKFEFSLWILVFASTCINLMKGNPLDFGNQITDALQSQVSNAQSQVTNIQNTLASATSMAENYGNQVKDSVQGVVSKFNEAVSQITSGTMGNNAMVCLAESVKFEKFAAAIQNNVMTCITDGISKITSQSTATISEIGSFMVIFTELSAKIQLCVPQGMNYVPCVLDTWISAMSKSPGSWISMLGQIGKLLANLATFQFTIAACGFTSSMADLAKEATESFNRINECVSKLFSGAS